MVEGIESTVDQDSREAALEDCCRFCFRHSYSEIDSLNIILLYILWLFVFVSCARVFATCAVSGHISVVKLIFAKLH